MAAARTGKITFASTPLQCRPPRGQVQKQISTFLSDEVRPERSNNYFARWQRGEERPSATPMGFLLPLPRQTELDRLLLLSFRSNTRSSWQLQHGRALTFTQPGEQNSLPVRKLKCIVIGDRLITVNLPESSHPLFDLPSPEDAKTTVVLNFRLERDLRAGKEAYCHVWLADCGEAASGGTAKACCFQLVSGLCRSGCDKG